jgi:AcrR family transcriptional regulator
MAHRGWKRDGFTPEKKRKAVKALAKYGTVVDAARAVGVSDTTFYRHLNKDPDFLRMCELAREEAAKPIETLAWERATIGAEEVVIRDGKVVQVKRKPSDAMLRMLLMASSPKRHGRMAGERRKVIEKEVRARIEAEVREELLRRQVATPEEVRAQLVKGLAALGHRLRAGEAEAEGNEWGEGDGDERDEDRV